MHGNNADYFANQTLIDALADFPLISLASPRNRKVVKELEEKALKGQFDELFKQATQLYAENYHKAIEGVLDQAKPGNTQYAYSAQFKHNVSNLAAWKAHRMAADLVKLKEPEKIKQEIKKYNQWQAVEYNAITSRARTARQLLDFETRKDIYPNLEWIRSRSANPREAHLQLAGLVLPVNHPFWNTNQPGNLYGCKCDWKQTDAPTSAVQPKGVPPSPGLDGNPVITGELITGTAGHFKNQDRSKVNPAILKLPETSASFQLETIKNQPIWVHMLHKKDELKENIQFINHLADVKPDFKSFKLLPRIHNAYYEDFVKKFYPKDQMPALYKNADAIINEKTVVEFKILKTTSNFDRKIRAASKQSKTIVFRLPQKNDMRYEEIKGIVDDAVGKSKARGIIVLNADGSMFYQNM